jgi:methylglyoxal synthase/pSer/pThr/pTyr-binding forkhead associated (FHA) protein
MKVKIAYLTTENEVHELDLVVATIPKGECIIGRSPDCDLPLESPDVSRIHGKLFVQAGKYYYCDTGSRNGSIVNNQLAVKNQPYILKHGDSIQIGDYFLKMEDMTPAAEQLPETVFRVIDPALFSRPVSPEVNVANINEPAPAVVSKLTEQVSSPTHEEKTTPEVDDVADAPDQEVITAPESQIIAGSQIVEERTFIQPEDIVTPASETVPDVTTTESDEDVDLSTPIAEERTFIQPEDIVTSALETVPDVTTTESDEDVDVGTPIAEEKSVLETGVETVEAEDIAASASETVPDVTTTESDENVDLTTPILPEFTIVQPRDINIQPAATESDEDVDLSTPLIQEFTQEFTIVQPRDINIQPAITEGDIEIGDLDTDDGVGEGNLAVESEVQPAATTDNDATEVVSNVDVEATEAVPEMLNESQTDVIVARHDNILPQAEVTEIISSEDSDEDVDVSSTTLEEVNREVTELEVFSTTDNLETPETETSISTTEVGENLVVVGEKLATVSEAEELQAVDDVEATVETNTEREDSQMSIQKNIVLIAHESKKYELAELVAKHQEFFSQSLTISWPSVSEVLKQEAGMTVSEEIPSPTSGGYQKINVLLGSGDILAMIFLRDFLTPAPSPTNEETLLKICNINQVLVATNLKTAEAIVYYLKNITDS